MRACHEAHACGLSVSASSSSLSVLVFCVPSSFSVCISCPVGKYAENSTMSACVECAAGTYTDGQVGQVECTICPVGGYCEISGGFTTFVLCQRGTYSPTERATSSSTCLACPEGTHTPLQGQEAERWQRAQAAFRLPLALALA